MSPAYTQALQLYRQGALAQAAAVLGDALRRDPKDASCLQLLGAIQFQLGFQREGIKLGERAVAVDPNHAEAWNNLGLMKHLAGRDEEAEGAFRHAVTLLPGFEGAWKNLAFVMQSDGRHEAALDALNRAGHGADVRFFRGNSLAEMGRFVEAIAEYEGCLQEDPEFGDAWNNRGNSLLALGMWDEAFESFHRAVGCGGDAALEAQCNLATALHQGGKSSDALAYIDKVLRASPDFSRAHEVRAAIERDLDHLDEAAQELSDLLDVDPSLDEARGALARILQTQGKWHLAIDSLKTATQPGLRILDALLMPVVFDSAAMAKEAMQRVTLKVAALLAEDLRIADPLKEVGVTTFHLPYFGESERHLQEQIAQLYLRSAPSLDFTAGHTPWRSSRIRLGVISGLLTRHTVSYVFGPLLERLPRDRFELVFMQIDKEDEASERFAECADRHVRLAPSLSAAREQIAREELDIAFFPEIGMEVLTYYLAFSRFAPIQVTTWGHPLTTGSPVIDHFISSVHLERPDGEREYSENLVRLPSLSTYYRRPPQPRPLTRAQVGLPDGARLYGCPQTAYKFHPDFDVTLEAILKRDELGRLVLIEPPWPYLKNLLTSRWERAHPLLNERAIWVPTLEWPDYQRLLQMCDALLVPTRFGSGRSSLDAFAAGCPVVTLEGPFLKSRITSAAYRQMGVLDLVASDGETYVDMAHRLGTDTGFQWEMRRKVADRAQCLFENDAAVNEVASFLASLSPM